MDKYLSNKIAFFHFFGVLLVLSLHSFLPGIENSPFNDVQRFGSSYLYRVYHPMMFGISGYLFFLGIGDGRWTQFVAKYKRRVKSLVLPYVVCNIIGGLFILWISRYGFPSENIEDCMRFYHKHGLLLFLFYKPAVGQLWFVKDLIIISIFSFPLYKALREKPILVLIVLMAILIATRQSIFLSFFSFSAGAVLSLFKVDIQKQRMPLWLAVGIYAMLLAFLYYFDAKVIGVYALSWIGFYAVWFGFDKIKTLNNIKFGGGIWKHSFFVYAFHDPLLNLTKWSLQGIYVDSVAFQAFFYLSLPIMFYLVLSSVGVLVGRYCPPIYTLLTGAR